MLCEDVGIFFLVALFFVSRLFFPKGEECQDLISKKQKLPAAVDMKILNSSGNLNRSPLVLLQGPLLLTLSYKQ